jgi:hypothetical protein
MLKATSEQAKGARMKKALTLTLAVGLFGILAAVVVADVGQDPPAGSTTPATATTEGRTTTTEAEDRRDVRDDDAPGDISGPCDETEHANDPRCDGVADPRPATPLSSPAASTSPPPAMRPSTRTTRAAPQAPAASRTTTAARTVASTTPVPKRGGPRRRGRRPQRLRPR